jgi:hypothetical protein
MVCGPNAVNLSAVRSLSELRDVAMEPVQGRFRGGCH